MLLKTQRHRLRKDTCQILLSILKLLKDPRIANVERINEIPLLDETVHHGVSDHII